MSNPKNATASTPTAAKPASALVADPELQALARIGKVLAAFEEPVRQRMVAFLASKYLPEESRGDNQGRSPAG